LNEPDVSAARRRAVEDECTRLSFTQLGYVTLSTSLLVLLLAAIIRSRAAPDRLVRWVVLYQLLALGRCSLILWYRRRSRTAPELRRKLPLLALAMLLPSTVWGGVAFVPARPDTVAYAISLLFAGGLIAGGAQSLIGTPKILMATSAVTVIPLVTVLLRSPSAEHRYLGYVAVFYFVSTLQFGRRNLRVLRESISLRFGNLDLVERLTREKARAEAARDEAEQAIEAKNQFLAAASHDIRQPLHAAFLFLGALEGEPAGEQPEIRQRLRASLNAARQMLDTLLDVSKLDAGVVDREDSTFSAQSLGRHVLEMFEPIAERKGLALALRAPAKLWLRSDPTLVQRVLVNLMSNAVKYTDAGAVLLVFRRRAEHCLVQVWDTGTGIAPEDHERIFDEFEQLGNPQRDGSRGIGLGLSIVRRLCRLLGAEVTVRSSVGRGSVFSFALPRGEAEPELGTPARESVAAVRARLLVVDDDALVREGLRALLSSWGYEIRTASDVEDARRVAAEGRPPDLALIDYRLPHEKTALDAVRAIRQATGREIPAIIITGDTHPQRIREATEPGFPVVFKPVPPELLRDALSTSLRTPA
jgi:signal transduction histidine kinase